MWFSRIHNGELKGAVIRVREEGTRGERPGEVGAESLRRAVMSLLLPNVDTCSQLSSEDLGAPASTTEASCVM